MNPTNNTTPQTDRIRRLPWVMDATGIKRTTIWKRERDGDFPKRVKLGTNSIGWRESEILAWVASRETVEVSK